MRKRIDELRREGSVSKTECLGKLGLDRFILLDSTGYALQKVTISLVLGEGVVEKPVG